MPAKPSKTTPTRRSLAYLRKQGYTVAIVEHWNQFARIRQDLFDFGDLLAIKPGEPILIVQTTTKSNQLARYKKIVSIQEAKTWLLAGGKIVVHGWADVAEEGKRKKWEVSERQVVLEDFVSTDADVAV